MYVCINQSMHSNCMHPINRKLLLYIYIYLSQNTPGLLGIASLAIRKMFLRVTTNFIFMILIIVIILSDTFHIRKEYL